jgi:hypothetical protein
VLQSVVQEKNLQTFYPPGNPTLDQIASTVTNQVDQLCTTWRVPKEVGQDIVKLALFDIILYIGDAPPFCGAGEKQGNLTDYR